MSVLRLTPRHPRRYFDRIAEIHLASIHHGALPHFGAAFMSHLYSELSCAAGTGVWGIVEKERITGFIAGSANLVNCYGSLLLHGGPTMLIWGMPALRRVGVLKRLAPLLLYPFRRPAKTDDNNQGVRPRMSAELLSIALEPEARGRGFGKALVREFEAMLHRRGVGEYGVTTNSTDPDSNAFYLQLGFRKAGQVPHHDLVLQRYRKTVCRS